MKPLDTIKGCFILILSLCFHTLNAQTYVKPSYSSRSSNSVDIARIEISPSATIVSFHFNGTRSCVQKAAYIEANGQKYYLVKTEGIPYCSGTKVYEDNTFFHLHFPPIKPSSSPINIIEDPNSTTAFNFYGVRLTEGDNTFAACSVCFGANFFYAKTTCSTCNGTGKSTGSSPCSACSGTGSIKKTCGTCSGTGRETYTTYQTQNKTVKKSCGTCNGSGRVRYNYSGGAYQDFFCNTCNSTGQVTQTVSDKVPYTQTRTCQTCTGVGTLVETHKECAGTGRLQSGSNCTACNGTGQRKATFSCTHSALKQKKPVIQWDEPFAANSVSTTEQTALKVCLQSPTPISSYKVYINDQLADIQDRGFDIEDDCAKRIDTRITLNKGQNTVYIVANNAGGSTTSDKRYITFNGTPTKPVNDNTPQYYALLMGVNDYDNLAFADLMHPISDAEKLGTALQTYYNFKPNNIRILRNPRKEDIVNQLSEWQQKLRPQDNLLVFYAGHGKEVNEVAYWLPRNADPSSRLNWFSASELTDYVKGFKTKHTLVIADACFSGALVLRDAVTEKVCAELQKLPSRRVMTSGAKEAVPDKSVFIQYLLKQLEDNTESCMSAEQLYIGFKNKVIYNSPINQVPQLGVLTGTGDEGGSFIFIKK